jgi:spore maturation protein CgeB
MEALANAKTELDLFGYGIRDTASGSSLRERYRGEAWGLDMYEVLSQSKVALNRHGEITEGYANNMRLFEATGVGALLFTESAPNLSELFSPGKEVVTYEGPSDLVEKVRHYLSADDERERIAANGQRRTLSDHTYEIRMADLVTLLKDRLPLSRANRQNLSKTAA